MWTTAWAIIMWPCLLLPRGVYDRQGSHLGQSGSTLHSFEASTGWLPWRLHWTCESFSAYAGRYCLQPFSATCWYPCIHNRPLGQKVAVQNQRKVPPLPRNCSVYIRTIHRACTSCCQVACWSKENMRIMTVNATQRHTLQSKTNLSSPATRSVWMGESLKYS